VILLTRWLPCLLVRQPYASLIAFGRKRWEFRSYNVRKRGNILIAASRGRPIKTGDETLNRAATSFPRGVLLASARLIQSQPVTANDIKKTVTGAVKTRIGEFEFWTADAPLGEPLVDLEMIPSTWHSYAWQFRDVQPMAEPIPLTRRSCSSWTTVATIER